MTSRQWAGSAQERRTQKTTPRIQVRTESGPSSLPMPAGPSTHNREDLESESALTPRKGLRGVGMVLKLQEAKRGGFFGLARPRECFVKELLAGGPASQCGSIAVGDRIVAIGDKQVEGLSLQQVCTLPLTNLSCISSWPVSSPHHFALRFVDSRLRDSTMSWHRCKS